MNELFVDRSLLVVAKWDTTCGTAAPHPPPLTPHTHTPAMPRPPGTRTCARRGSTRQCTRTHSPTLLASGAPSRRGSRGAARCVPRRALVRLAYHRMCVQPSLHPHPHGCLLDACAQWDSVVEWEFNTPSISWFKGAELNVSGGEGGRVSDADPPRTIQKCGAEAQTSCVRFAGVVKWCRPVVCDALEWCSGANQSRAMQWCGALLLVRRAPQSRVVQWRKPVTCDALVWHHSLSVATVTAAGSNAGCAALAA